MWRLTFLSLVFLSFNPAEANIRRVFTPKLEGIVGKVELIRYGKKLNLTREKVLQSGDILRTNRYSKVRVKGVRNFLQIGASSTLRIKSVSKKGEMLSVDLIYGSFHLQTKKGLAVSSPNGSFKDADGVYFVHIFKDQLEYNKLLAGLFPEPLSYGQSLQMGSGQKSYTQVSVVEGKLWYQPKKKGGTKVQIRKGEMIRAQGLVVDSLAKNVGVDQILSNERAIGFID